MCTCVFAPRRLVLVTLLVVLTHAAGAQELTVYLLDGSQHQAAAISGSDDGRQLSIGDQRLALADIDRIVVTGQLISDRAQRAVVLRDGGWLPVSAIAADHSDHLRCTTTAFGTLTIPLDQLLAWGPPPWLDRTRPLAASRGAHDRLLLANEELNGEVHGVGPKGLIFAPEIAPDTTMTIALTDVIGLSLGETPRPPHDPHLLLDIDPGMPPLFLHPGPTLTIGGLEAAALEWSALPAGTIRIAGPRRVWLSELDPALVEEEGAFGVTWPHRRDSNLDGSPLVLDGRRHHRGVVVHSQARLVWQLGGAYSRFHSLLGIADIVGSEGDCLVVLRVDDQVLWEGRLRGGERPHSIDAEVSGAQRLELRVDFGERYDIGDHVALAGAWLARAP